MKYKKLRKKKFFKLVRRKPSKAIKVLKLRPELATVLWDGSSKWIPGSTPLHWAAHDGHLQLVHRLIEEGADIDADQADWWSRPIDWAADGGQPEVVDYLLRHGASVKGDRWSNATPLHVVAQGGSTNARERSDQYRDVTLLLIVRGVEINGIAQYGGQGAKVTALDDAIRVGNQTVIDILRRHGGKLASELEDNKS